MPDNWLHFLDTYHVVYEIVGVRKARNKKYTF